MLVGVAVIAGTAGFGFTVILTDADFVQPFASVPVTVYIVVADGFAVTELDVVELNAVDGDQT
jgi:PII-like signaling protein